MRLGSVSSADGELVVCEAVQAEEREREGGGEGSAGSDVHARREGRSKTTTAELRPENGKETQQQERTTNETNEFSVHHN